MNELKTAKEISKQSRHRCKHGAVITKNNKIVSIGYNLHLPYPHHQKTFNTLKTIHAEAMAILRAKNKRDLIGGVIYVYSERNLDGKMRLSRPCQTCIRMLKSFKISKMVYSSPDGIIEENVEQEGIRK